MDVKISIIGGGSYSWMRILFLNFLSNPYFKGYTICLMDVVPEALDDLYELCLRYNQLKPEMKIKITKTTDLNVALFGAAYVIVSISHGHLEAELEDHRIGRKYGFWNVKGSESGVAGASRTFRHVPETLRIARMMEKVCPNAMLLNVTNPLTAITRAVNKYTSIKCYGFCHGVINHLGILLPFFGANGFEGVDFNVGGIDHCSWLLDVRYRGQNALQIMRDKGMIEMARQGKTLVASEDPFSGRENQRLRFLIWDIIGYLPACSDEHCVEFFGQIMGDETKRKYYKVSYDRIKERISAVRKAKEKIKMLLNGKDNLRIVRNSEIIDRFIAALNGEGEFIDVLNAPNVGQIQNLPEESIVESRCVVNATGVHPVMVGALPRAIETIVNPLLAREELYMEAAAEDSFEKLRAALSMDPLVNDFRVIDDVARDIIEYNRRYRKE